MCWCTLMWMRSPPASPSWSPPSPPPPYLWQQLKHHVLVHTDMDAPGHPLHCHRPRHAAPLMVALLVLHLGQVLGGRGGRGGNVGKKGFGWGGGGG